MDLSPLYRWYRKSGRDLPFRADRDPYRIWISEIMLQQTRMSTVLPRYSEFMKIYPSVQALAEGGLDQVLQAWKGLGYYSRARNLHAGARHIVEKHNGIFPDTMESALEIPGVGRYTAAAVISIAYDKPHPVVDGNIKRIFCRLFNQAGEPPEKYFREKSYILIEQCNSPGEHNQALMELGETICVPGRPDCMNCPLKNQCLSYQTGQNEYASGIGVRSPQKKNDVELVVQVFADNRKPGLWLFRGERSYFFKNLWFYPCIIAERKKILWQSPKSSWLKQKSVRRFENKFRHSITNHRITGRVEIHEIDSSPGAENLFRVPEGEYMFVEFSLVENSIVSSIRKKAELIYADFILPTML